MNLQVVLDRLHNRRLQPHFVGPAPAGADAIRVAPHLFVGRLGPAEHHPNLPLRVLAVGGEDRFRDRFLAPVAHQLRQVPQQSVGVQVLDRFLPHFVVEHEGQPPMHVRHVFQPLADHRRVVRCLAKNRVVGTEENRRSPPPERAHLLQRGGRASRLEPLKPLVPVTMHRRGHLGRQGVHHR